MERSKRAPGLRKAPLPVMTIVSMVALFCPGCSGPGENPGPSLEGSPAEESPAPSIDQRSYRLGSIGAFAEMVGAGVKRLALSAPMDPDEVEALIGEARRIADEHRVGLYLEEDFLVTDLFSPELTEGKHVLVICLEATWDEYMELKGEKARLEAEGLYEGEARLEIAREFGALLSYSEEKVEALLEAGEEGR